ncbi:MAG: HDOD domain-containing protein [Thiohalomonadales bacterium]
MSITLLTKRFLQHRGVRNASITITGELEEFYQLGSDSIQAEHIAKSVVLEDSRGIMMAIIPASHEILLDVLNQRMQRSLKIIDQVTVRGIQLDCKPGRLPCLGEAFGFETIVDDALLENDFIYFTSGAVKELIRITGYDFQLIHSNAWYGNTFSEAKQTSTNPVTRLFPDAISPAESKTAKILQKIEKTGSLPAMPTMALQIIQLNSNPYAHVNDLAILVEKDPSLTAQIVRHAQSPLYGYQGKITSVKQAISRVLGYDMVMNIALGIAATRPFRNTLIGPLGIDAYWRHATYSAALCQSLCSLFPQTERPRTGTAYLCGLLHNFGFLLLGHLFPQELKQINTALIKNPQANIRELERNIMQLTHTEIGSYLMKCWNMPDEIVVTLSQHHNIDYRGEHCEYANLVLLADILLKGHDIGDADGHEIPAKLLEQLNINEDKLYAMLEKTIRGREDLDIMAKQMAA